MTGKEIVKQIMQEQGLSQVALAMKTKKKQQDISGYIMRGKHEMRLDIFESLMKAMGYEVIVRSTKDGEKREIKVNFD